jgi:hypothetical protein
MVISFGEVTERLKVRDWKSRGRVIPPRGFESHPLRLRLLAWLDPQFDFPTTVDVDGEHHLRPLREADVDLDYPAVIGSRPRLWEKYGDVWGWPAATLTYERDRDDLARHEGEIRDRRAFVYALFDSSETRLLGCLYIDPPEPGASDEADALVSWWVVDDVVDTELERSLARLVPRWLSDAWPFETVRYHP